MRDSRESYVTNFCTRLLFLGALLILAGRLPGIAQKAAGSGSSAPKYDLHVETTVKGTVDEVKLPPKANEIAYLAVKSGSDVVDVYLCPKSFLDDMGVTYSKGDEVVVTGAKAKLDASDIILAREIVKGNDTVTLRDNKGLPVWTWQK